MKQQETKEMSLEDAMTFVINDEPYMGESRKWFSDKDAANTYSESLKDQWSSGTGQVYGPFVGRTLGKWWEVSYKETA